MQNFLIFVFVFLLGLVLGWFLNSTLHNLTNMAGSLFMQRELTREQKKTVFRLFHTVWSKAVGTQDYVKNEWNELSNLLTLVGVLDNS